MAKVGPTVTHLGAVLNESPAEEDPLDRELQSTELARIMRASPRPVIFLGYVVTKPHQPRRTVTVAMSFRGLT
jgi:hypothetical protein